jgi:hypothetical protein
MSQDILTTKTFIDKLNLLDNYDDDFIIKYYLTTISYDFGKKYLISKRYYSFDESYEQISEFKDIINQITSITFDQFKEIYIENKPFLKDKKHTKNDTTLKGYINSNKFNIFKFMFLNISIKRYIVLLFNSKKSIEFLNKDVSMISYNFDNFTNSYDYHYISDFNMNTLFPILILNALKSNKFISFINDQLESIQISENQELHPDSSVMRDVGDPVPRPTMGGPLRRQNARVLPRLTMQDSPVGPDSKKRKTITNLQNLNLFCFLKTNKHINTIIKIISKMNKIHLKFNHQNNSKYSKFEIIKDPVFLEFSEAKYINEDVKDIIGPYLYKYYKGFIKSKVIHDKLIILLDKIKLIKNYRFFKTKLKELDKIIDKDRKINNISNESGGDPKGQAEGAQIHNMWFRDYLFIETINIKVRYDKLNIKSYNSVTDNESSNKHLKKIYKHTKFSEISDS